MTTAFGVVVLWLLLLAGIAVTKQRRMENIITCVWGGMVLGVIYQAGKWVYSTLPW